MAGGDPDGGARRVPDFFVVGHPKCGTTALYEMLRRHPQLYLPDLKEPWYFATDVRARFQPARSGAVPETLAEYLALFAAAGPGQRTGEASSSYLRSRAAPGAIARLRPDARIIAIFREPADFLRSLHHQLLLDHIETEKDLGAALELEPARREGRKIPRRSHLPQMLLYSDHVRYAEQLRRYHDAFGREQVLALIYEEFREDNEGTLGRVERFLGVEPDPARGALQANPSDRRMRSQRLDELVHAVSVGTGPASRAAKAVIKTALPGDLPGRALRATRRSLVYGRPEPPDEELMARLRERFHREVEALGECLGRDLVTLWRR